jgi:predicted molibdopterin-dependent oxidoreductase YjgC
MKTIGDHVLGGVATTVCPFCGTGCGMLLDDGAAYPLLNHPIARGALCLRGWSAGELLRSPARLRRARARDRGGTHLHVRHEDALLDVAAALKRLVDRHGGECIGILGSARITTEEQLLLRRLACTLDTPHLDSFQRLGCLEYGEGPLSDLDEGSRLLVVGVDVATRMAQAGRHLMDARRHGAEVRFVASRRLQFAGEHLTTCLPGREVDEAVRLADGDLVLWSAELALQGQAGPAIRRLGPLGAEYLVDYANQQGLLETGIHPRDGGASAYEMLQRAADGQLKALLIFADDPFEFFPDLAAHAFASAEMVVVVDAVQTRSTAEADVVFPGALLAEKRGTVRGGGGGAGQALEPVQQPLAGWTEGMVARRLLELLGGEMDIPPHGFVPGPDAPPADVPTPEFPFLATLDAGTLWENHALVKATITAWREARAGATDYPDGYLSISPSDARTLGIRAWAPVRLESDTGGVTLTARLDPRVVEGSVALPMRCWERAGTALGALALDPCLRIPIFRPRAVRLGRG